MCAPNECPDGGGCPDGEACGRQACGTACVAPVATNRQCGSINEATCTSFVLPCVDDEHCVSVHTDFPPELPLVCVAPASGDVGAACGSDGDCLAELFCTGVCQECDDAHACPDGQLCEDQCDAIELGDARKCVTPAGASDACNDCTNLSGFFTPCTAPLSCHVDQCE